jgi:hypothetical protein
MSWDVFVQDLPPAARATDDIPDGFRPGPLAIRDRDEIIQLICEVAPGANFRDPSWGIIEGPGFSIEVNLGDQDVLDNFAFHVEGHSEEAPDLICRILNRLGMRAVADDTNAILPGPEALEAFRRWRDLGERRHRAG